MRAFPVSLRADRPESVSWVQPLRKRTAFPGARGRSLPSPGLGLTWELGGSVPALVSAERVRRGSFSARTLLEVTCALRPQHRP